MKQGKTLATSVKGECLSSSQRLSQAPQAAHAAAAPEVARTFWAPPRKVCFRTGAHRLTTLKSQKIQPDPTDTKALWTLCRLGQTQKMWRNQSPDQPIPLHLSVQAKEGSVPAKMQRSLFLALCDPFILAKPKQIQWRNAGAFHHQGQTTASVHISTTKSASPRGKRLRPCTFQRRPNQLHPEVSNTTPDWRAFEGCKRDPLVFCCFGETVQFPQIPLGAFKHFEGAKIKQRDPETKPETKQKHSGFKNVFAFDPGTANNVWN